MEREECITSNHHSIFGATICFRVLDITPKGLSRVTKDKPSQFARLFAQWIMPVTVPDTLGETDKMTKDICCVLKDSVNAVSKRTNRANGKSAHLEYRNAVTDDEWA